jgi:predicted nucleotidyltransferase
MSHTDVGDDMSDITNLHDTPATRGDLQLPQIPWLDSGTTEALRRTIVQLIGAAPEIVAMILFGSVARHEERPFTDPQPSDVDVLVLFDPSIQTADDPKREHGMLSEGLTQREHKLLSAAVVQALIEVPQGARDINLTGALTTFAGWDSAFVKHIAQDGILSGPVVRCLRHSRL